MDALLWLFLLCGSMFLGAFLAGSIPLAFNLNEERLKVVSAFGAGILVGTALIVILPEGVLTLYSVANDPHSHESPGGWQPLDGTHYMGVALAFGFVAMFMVDQLGPTHSHSHHIAVGNLAQIPEPPVQFSAAFLGLLVHNAADGVAMGAASAGTNQSLEMIVFLAILLHKAPAAFGLTTFLLNEGHTRKSVRQLLAIFCAVPPVTTLITYQALQLFKLDVPQHIWTGLVLLFSAGSFLYVATIHVMPELIHKSSQETSQPSRLSKVQFAAMIAGMFTPLILQVEHGHSHGGSVVEVHSHSS